MFEVHPWGFSMSSLILFPIRRTPLFVNNRRCKDLTKFMPVVYTYDNKNINGVIQAAGLRYNQDERVYLSAQSH